MADQHLTHAAATDNPEVHHEETDVNIRAILGFAAALTVVAIVIHVAIWGLYRVLDASQTRQQKTPDFPLATQQEQRLPPEPRLQTNPRQDLADLRAQEDAALSSYGWVDRNAGTVRIPIEQAMKLTLERGLPARTTK
jgi:hypothetical protein